MNEKEFTVGDLKRHLAGIPDNYKLLFAGGLHFYRLKRWADDELVFEFSEYQADIDTKEFPNILVAFCKVD